MKIESFITKFEFEPRPRGEAPRGLVELYWPGAPDADIERLRMMMRTGCRVFVIDDEEIGEHAALNATAADEAEKLQARMEILGDEVNKLEAELRGHRAERDAILSQRQQAVDDMNQACAERDADQARLYQLSRRIYDASHGDPEFETTTQALERLIDQATRAIEDAETMMMATPLEPTLPPTLPWAPVAGGQRVAELVRNVTDPNDMAAIGQVLDAGITIRLRGYRLVAARASDIGLVEVGRDPVYGTTIRRVT